MGSLNYLALNKQWRIQKGSRTDFIIFIAMFKKNERSSANLHPLPSSGVVDPPLNKKAYIMHVDISGFTGKPVKGEGLNDPRGV